MASGWIVHVVTSKAPAAEYFPITSAGALCPCGAQSTNDVFRRSAIGAGAPAPPAVVISRLLRRRFNLRFNFGTTGGSGPRYVARLRGEGQAGRTRAPP